MKYDQFAQAYLSMITEQTQILSEEMLMEDRIDWLKSNVKSINSSHDTFALHRDPHAIIDFLATNADPSKKKVHTQHLIRMYNAGKFRQEDAPRVHDTLFNFDKYKSKLPEEQRDINKHADIASIERAVQPHLGTASTNAEAREQLKKNFTLNIPDKHELMYDDSNISIYHLKDKETSQKLYASAKSSKKPGVYPTEWCTAAESDRHNMFDTYHTQGNLFVIHRKSDGEVFQFHPNTNQFMNKEDRTITQPDFDSIKDSFHKALDTSPKLVGF